MRKIIALFLFLAGSVVVFAGEHENEIIINEIGNSGTKKGAYTGKDYIELLVLKPEGVRLAGWYLTDLASPSSKGKENEGAIRFSAKEGSVFNQIIPQGTYVVVCMGHSGDTVGTDPMKEEVLLTGGKNRIVVFADSLSRHIERTQGNLILNGKDNLVLLGDWKKDAAVNMLVWEGGCSWTGCTPLEVPKEMIDNGAILYFTPGGIDLKSFYHSTEIVRWASSTYPGDATPGKSNPGVDDRILHSKK
ncbi:MAG: hypothetical protein NTV54_06480 [Ignavibacteriales bacterium]|nr:hypothetical protein [Ignavibacteriales bacterium]